MAISQTMCALMLLLLAVYGCVQGIRWLVLRLIAPPRDSKSVWLLPLVGHREDVEYLVRSTAARCRWSDYMPHDIWVVDAGADEETVTLARHMCDEASGVRFLDAGELPDFFEEWAK